MVVSCHHSTGQNHGLLVANKSLENMAIRYFGTTVINKNFIHEEIKSLLHLGNVDYHSVHCLSSSHFLSKNLKIKIDKP
jgi:hypothetical protein